MCHTLNNHPAHIYGSFSQRTAFKFGMVAGLNALGLLCFSNGLLCCILKRTSSACALCVAWFVRWLRRDEDDVVCCCKYCSHCHTLLYFKVHS